MNGSASSSASVSNIWSSALLGAPSVPSTSPVRAKSSSCTGSSGPSAAQPPSPSESNVATTISAVFMSVSSWVQTRAVRWCCTPFSHPPEHRRGAAVSSPHAAVGRRPRHGTPRLGARGVPGCRRRRPRRERPGLTRRRRWRADSHHRIRRRRRPRRRRDHQPRSRRRRVCAPAFARPLPRSSAGPGRARAASSAAGASGSRLRQLQRRGSRPRRRGPGAACRAHPRRGHRADPYPPKAPGARWPRWARGASPPPLLAARRSWYMCRAPP